jgi:hypothetical protein
MSTKIIVQLFGGLGNQLFMYSAARRLALYNNSELVIDNISGFKINNAIQRKYQLDKFNIHGRLANYEETLQPFSRIKRYFLRNYNNLLNFSERNYIQQEFQNFDSRILYLNNKKTIYFVGYWQSENYFKDIEKKIRNELSYKYQFNKDNLFLSKFINSKNSVAVHLRFYEKNEFNNNTLNLNYYIQSIKYIEAKITNPHFFVFTNKNEINHDYLPIAEHKITYVNINKDEDMEYADLWLMNQCNHFIIANSTFSWWGAWLSSNDNKIIIAPSKENVNSNSWAFKELIPDSWIII